MFKKTSRRPEELTAGFVGDLQSIFDQMLESVILYGSGAREDYAPGRSDLNFLVCVAYDGLKYLDRVWRFIDRWQKQKIALPLFVTQDFVLSSADVFPVEFLNMKLHHRCIFGEDVLEKVEINRENLRLQLEREFRGKLLHLREGFVASQGRERDLKQLISASISAFASLFVGLLYLQDVPVPSTRREVFSSLRWAFEIESDVLDTCLAIREGRWRPHRGEVVEVYREYLEIIRRICQMVDKMASEKSFPEV